MEFSSEKVCCPCGALPKWLNINACKVLKICVLLEKILAPSAEIGDVVDQNVGAFVDCEIKMMYTAYRAVGKVCRNEGSAMIETAV